MLAVSDIVYADFANKFFFGVRESFFMNFDFKNGRQNEFKDNKEKSCSIAAQRPCRQRGS